eukprot:330665-Pleurochrysis_carterae.AAC.1
MRGLSATPNWSASSHCRLQLHELSLQLIELIALADLLLTQISQPSITNIPPLLLRPGTARVIQCVEAA